MKKHTRDHLADQTFVKLAMLLITSGNRNSDQGVPIVVPADVAEHIHALAADANTRVAKGAKLTEAVATNA